MATHESILTFDPDDPRWTAYVLGEVEAGDRAEFDAVVEASPDARRYVAELRQVTGLVGASLLVEPAAIVGGKLTAPVARRELVERAQPAEPIISRRRQRIYQATVALAVSALLVVLFLPGGILRSLTSSRYAANIEKSRQLGLALNNHHSTQLDSQLNSTDPVPVPNDQPIVYPPSEKWKDLANRRLHYKKSDFLRTPAATPNDPTPQESYAGTSSQSEPAEKVYPVADLVLPLNLKPTITVSGGTLSTSGTVTNNGTVTSGPASTATVGQVNVNTTPGYGLSLSGNSTAPIAHGVDKLARGNYNRDEVEYTDAARYADTDAKVPRSANLRIVVQESEDGVALVRRSELLHESLIDDVRATTWGEDGAVTREFDNVVDNPFLPARDNPLSTFSVDVDTASYSIVRRFIAQEHRLPPKSAVRIEELINYFHYDYPQPTGEAPVATTAEVVSCPWNAEHQLVRVAVKAREVPPKKRPPTNLVFLVDVSGSMNQPNKLPLVKQAMKLLVGQLTENDRVAIVVYAGNSGLVLPSITGDQRAKIDEVLDRLEAGGSTNGGEGIQLAYELALRNFVRGGANRVILATDGDFNVGITDREALIKLIEEQAKSGVFLTALGFGMDNLKDGTLEQLADKGNGHYAFIDTFEEARKVFVDEINGTLVTVAKDVKIQIEFNPAAVGSYRLIGYENRALKAEDFNNDKKDAGDMGSGHTVTALYEIAPVGAPTGAAPVDPLKYQSPPIKLTLADAATSDELMTLKLRYKEPDAQTSNLMEVAVKRSNLDIAQASADFKFAAAVASFGMTLRDSPYKGRATIDTAIKLAEAGQGTDSSGYRAQFVELLKQAKSHLPAVKTE